MHFKITHRRDDEHGQKSVTTGFVTTFHWLCLQHRSMSFTTMLVICIVMRWTGSQVISRIPSSWWTASTGTITYVGYIWNHVFISAQSEKYYFQTPQRRWFQRKKGTEKKKPQSHILIVACSSGYELDAYPQWSSINSQVNEQMNSGLARLKSSLSFMGQDTFLKSCTLYLYMVNQDKQGIVPVVLL